jgi:hypothetical protein
LIKYLKKGYRSDFNVEFEDNLQVMKKISDLEAFIKKK